jgi:hypothetical protein
MKTQRNIRGAAIAALIATASLTGASHAQAQPAKPRELGGVELGGYCQSIGHWGAILEENHAFGWKCHEANQRSGIDMSDACRWQYSNPAAIATFRDARNPYSWYCFINSS